MVICKKIVNCFWSYFSNIYEYYRIRLIRKLLSMPISQHKEATVYDNIIQIPYYYKGQEFEIFLPISKKIFDHQILLLKDGRINIMKHNPIIPLHVSAEDLNVDKIIFYDPLEDKQVKIFSGKQLPQENFKTPTWMDIADG